MTGATNGNQQPANGAARTEAVRRAGFIGRAPELDALHGRLADARVGRGGMVMVVGEPGIGKTRTTQEFAAAARAADTLVLCGRCYEGDWSPPYAPWIEALSPYAGAVSARRLRHDLGSVAPPLAHLVPAIRAALPDVPPPTPLGPEEERVRLYDAVVQFLLAVAADATVVLVLDDLHWADRASLGVLRHLARFLEQARVLVVGAYRDVDVDRRHPLTDVLGSLHRERGYQRLPLRGLNQTEVGDFLAQAARREVSPELAQAIYDETDGNPFFAGEVLRHLFEEGKLIPDAGRWTTTQSIRELGIPEGVRQVVGHRLARLAPETNRMLEHAAVFTGGFDFRVLQALTELPEAVLLDGIDEALQAQLIQAIDEKTETYDFVHAIVRGTLYDEWSPSRKVRIHRRLAEAFARVYAGQELDHAAELAEQYHASATLPGAAQGILYALAAAEQAKVKSAHEQAVTFLRMARDLATDVDYGSRGRILSKLAIAEADALMLDDAQRSVEAALPALNESDAEPATIASFLSTVATALEEGGAPSTVWRPLVQRGLALVDDRHDLTWARLTLNLKPFEPVSDGRDGVVHASRWVETDPRAVAIARASGDEDDYARSLQPFDRRTREETRDLLARARTWDRPAAITRALILGGADWLYYHGGFREAVQTFSELLAVAERYGSIVAQAEALVRLTVARIALGELDVAQRTAARAKAMVERLGPSHHLRVSEAWLSALLAEYLDGDWPTIAADWTRFASDPQAADWTIVIDEAALAALAHARAGAPAEAKRLLASLTPILTRMDPTHWLVNGAVGLAAGAVWSLGATELAPAYRQLAHGLVTAGVGDYPLTCNELSAARMSALLGEMDDAEASFARARRALDASGQRPLRAIVDYDEALALVRCRAVDQTRATALLQAALVEFRALEMAEWARRALTALEGIAQTEQRAEAEQTWPAGLTEREVDVLRLVVRGYSDRQVGDALFISPRTVHAHVRHMLAKTTLANRTELSVWAVEHGLVAQTSEV